MPRAKIDLKGKILGYLRSNGCTNAPQMAETLMRYVNEDRSEQARKMFIKLKKMTNHHWQLRWDDETQKWHCWALGTKIFEHRYVHRVVELAFKRMVELMSCLPLSKSEK